ncbi:MAG TPA: MarR family transcriptional regulator [Armatimonadota bacterium]|nr:MarR family transcriptional regulator [Armatimonadota bacterium]
MIEEQLSAGDSVAELQERFVLHWGEMANAWGINRTMGQIHALLYVSPAPLSAEEIMERLKISRGNASMNLRALEDWGIVQRVHFTGDRREYFRCVTDVWELFHILLRERKRREFDPTVRALQQFLHDAGQAGGDEPALELYRQRMGALLGMLQTLERAGDRLLPRDPHELPGLLEVDVDGLD